MKFLDRITKYFGKKSEKVVINKINYSIDGSLADVYFSNGAISRVRTEKALREMGVLDSLFSHHENH